MVPTDDEGNVQVAASTGQRLARHRHVGHVVYAAERPPAIAAAIGIQVLERAGYGQRRYGASGGAGRCKVLRALAIVGYEDTDIVPVGAPEIDRHLQIQRDVGSASKRR